MTSDAMREKIARQFFRAEEEVIKVSLNFIPVVILELYFYFKKAIRFEITFLIIIIQSGQDMLAPFSTLFCSQASISLYKSLQYFTLIKNYSSRKKTSIMVTVLPLVLLFLNLAVTSCSFTLGANLVTNGGFQNPIIPLLSNQYSYSLNIPSWKCKNKCKIIKPSLLSVLFPNVLPNISGQVLDLDSSSNEVVNQTFTLTSLGQYQLKFQWIPPVVNGIGRFVQVYLNSVMVVNITINATNSITLFPFTYTGYANLTSSPVMLSFKMGGTSNNHGIMIDNVAFHQVIVQQNAISNQTSNSSNTTNNNSSVLPNSTVSIGNTNSTAANLDSNNTLNQTNSSNRQINNQTIPPAETMDSDQSDSWPFRLINIIIFNNFSSTLNSVPGGRVFFSTFLNALTNFDRLQFYYFHQQNFTYNSEKFLSMINVVQNNKGSIISTLLQSYQNSSSVSFIPTILNWHSDLIDSLNYKQNYSDPWISERTGQGVSFLANNFDFFFYSIIGTLFSHFTLNLVFRILFNYKISLYFRKYCFSAIIFFELLQGNMQQFTFYYFQQIKSLFFFTFNQKLQLVFVIYFYFLILFVSIGGIILLKYWYKKYIKYFIQDYKKQLTGLVFLGIQTGVMPIAFGMAHSLLIHNLAVQTIVLALLQFIISSITITLLVKNIFEVRLTICIQLLISYLRIFFILTFYIYNEYSHREMLNNIHFALIVIFVLFWIIEIAAQVLYFLADLCMSLKKMIKFNNQKSLQSPKRKVIAAPKTYKVLFSTQQEKTTHTEVRNQKNLRSQKKKTITIAMTSKVIFTTQQEKSTKTQLRDQEKLQSKKKFIAAAKTSKVIFITEQEKDNHTQLRIQKKVTTKVAQGDESWLASYLSKKNKCQVLAKLKTKTSIKDKDKTKKKVGFQTSNKLRIVTK